jgi:plastocyanin
MQAIPCWSAVCLLLWAAPAVFPAPDESRREPPSGVVVGTVTYDGPHPKSVPVIESGTVRHLVKTDAKTGGLADVVLWLEGVKPPARKGKKPKAVMDQRNFFFVPNVLAIEAGQEVEFLNSDAANHGVLASAAETANSFNILTPPGQCYKHTFRSARQPVRIGCPIHSSMSAWIVVFDHPWFAVTDSKGTFRLPSVPPGDYTLHVRHLDTGMHRKQRVSVKDGKTTRVAVALGKADFEAGK